MANENSERREADDEGGERWKHNFEWIDPRAAHFASSDLHWDKISPAEVRQGFDALERLRGALDLDALNQGSFRHERDCLESLRDEEDQSRFNADDLGWFDTFFGGDRIKVDVVNEGFDVTNGRHRLWMAQQCGIDSLPAYVARKKGDTMGRELSEVEEAAEQQENRGDELKDEVEAHEERVEKLDEAVQQLQGMQETLDSDQARQALQEMQNARQETLRLLEEKRAEQQELLEENARMGEENAQAFREAQQALEKVEAIAQMAGNDEGGLAGHLGEMQASLQQDVEHRMEIDRALLQAQQKLQLVF